MGTHSRVARSECEQKVDTRSQGRLCSPESWLNAAPRRRSPPCRRRRCARCARSSRPLLPDDYLELINPLWSTRELRGRIERIQHETDDAVTILIRPGCEWEGHEPGQYLRIGVVVDGVHHWRAYSLTSDPGRPDGCISITPKLVDEGKVSPYFVQERPPGRASCASVASRGRSCFPTTLPEQLLFISAGSGITPIMSMLREPRPRDAIDDVVHIHSARDARRRHLRRRSCARSTSGTTASASTSSNRRATGA